MSLEKMELEELIGDLMSIGNLIEEAQEARSVHAPPEVRARGQAQLPVLLKCESLLSEELHRRLGGRGEFAEVAIDALEEYVIEQQKRRILADTFGPLESREDVEEREAEEREALGTTIREIEAAEAQADEAFAIRQYRPWLWAESDAEVLQTAAEATTEAAESLDVHSLGLPKCLRGKDHNPILWAMKEAAWASLQRLGTDVLIEYLKLWVVKHHDYGPENHAVWGCQGAIIRATDKLMRLKGSYFDGRTMEIVENDWLDLIGYGLIGLIVERGQWPVTDLETVIEAMHCAEGEAMTSTGALLHVVDTICCPNPACGSNRIRITKILIPSQHNCFEVSLRCEDCHEVHRGITEGDETPQETIDRLAERWQLGWRLDNEHD